MSNYENILFDFDGTICDTSEGIFASMQKVVDYYKLPYGQADFKKMIGPSLKESFTTIFHLQEKEITNAIKVYRDFYGVEGMYMCTPYHGIVELIKELRAGGKHIYVATSKPELYTKQIIERKKMTDLFDFIGGADLAEQKRIEKIQVINYVLEENNLVNKKDSCLMIGDRNYDINGAHAAGMKGCGVLWGFGSRKEFEDCGADFICEKPADVLRLV